MGVEESNTFRLRGIWLQYLKPRSIASWYHIHITVAINYAYRFSLIFINHILKLELNITIVREYNIKYKKTGENRVICTRKTLKIVGFFVPRNK